VKRSAPTRRTGLKRSRKPPKRNVKRRASEFARCYGSKARVAFVRSLPCSACGVIGYSQNAHVCRVGGGMGRKAHYTTIVPLRGAMHRELHQIGRASFEEKYGVDLDKAAADTQAAWLQFSGAEDVDE
jgi:hypothetical protein